MNQLPVPPSFDRGLLDEPGYAVALAELLEAIEAEHTGAYETIARRHPRYAAALLEAALIALPAERRLRQETTNVVREEPAGYNVRQAVVEGIAAARRTLE